MENKNYSMKKPTNHNDTLQLIEEYESSFDEGTIIDGVIDAESYLNSKIKIAWFLKEAYSNEKDGYHIMKHLGQDDAYESFFKNIATQTWHPIIYVSYGALNEFTFYDDMYYIRDRPEMCDVIQNIAIINANKMPSITGTYTLHKNLTEGFDSFKELIQQQIQVLQPQVHIFCNTFHLYKDLFNLTDSEIVSQSDYLKKCTVYYKEDKLFLDVYHPANRILDRETYVDQIIESIKGWYLKIKHQ